MLEQMDTYVMEKTANQTFDRLARAAREPSWVEQIAALLWVPGRIAIRILGRLMVAAGRGMVRASEQPETRQQPQTS